MDCGTVIAISNSSLKHCTVVTFPPLAVYRFHSCFINTAAKEKYDLGSILVPISIAHSVLCITLQCLWYHSQNGDRVNEAITSRDCEQFKFKCCSTLKKQSFLQVWSLQTLS